MTLYTHACVVVAVAIGLCPWSAQAQTYIPHSYVPVSISIAPPAASSAARTEAREVVRVQDATSIRLHFSRWNLEPGSELVIRSLADGAEQRHTHSSLAEWEGTTAFFNGDAVQVTLYAAPSEKKVYVEASQATAIYAADQARDGSESICGTSDDRVPTTDDASGRIVPVGCTGWATSAGVYLTAGHCIRSGPQVIEFRVPASTSSGIIRHPAPQFQFPAVTFRSRDTGVGDDWAVLRVGDNASGAPPHQVMGPDYYRLSDLVSPSTIRITGYGIDNEPTRNQTLQTHSGPKKDENVNGANRAYWEYEVDTERGNSGSGILSAASTFSVGIHTSGGCGVNSGANKGTSFENQLLEQAISDESGGATYVDAGALNIPAWPFLPTGSPLRAYPTLSGGLANVPAGGTLVLAAGNYPGSVTLSQPVRIRAASGPVRIGPSVPASQSVTPAALIVEEAGRIHTPAGFGLASSSERHSARPPGTSELPEQFVLGKPAPNPASDATTLSFGLSKLSSVQVRIYDILGRLVQSREEGATPAGWHQLRLTVEDLRPGTYVVQLSTESTRLTHRFTVMR